MGNISNKLEYLAETKEYIKDAILEKGVDVDDDDPFRSYANKILSIVTKAQTLNVPIWYCPTTHTISNYTLDYLIEHNDIYIPEIPISNDVARLDSFSTVRVSIEQDDYVIADYFTLKETDQSATTKSYIVLGKVVEITEENNVSSIRVSIIDGVKVDNINSGTNIKPENIRAGISVLGTLGTMQEGIDTSDATATAADIKKDKTAYANGEEIVGTYEEWVPTETINITENGIYNVYNMTEANVNVVSNTPMILNGMKLGNSTALPQNLDISSVVDMSYMFWECSTLTTIPNYNTNNVTNIAYAFCNCLNLVSAPNFDTSKVVNISGMFERCRNLIDVPNYNTSNVTNMSYMFLQCNNLPSVPNFDTSNVTTMSNTFFSCQNLSSIPNFNTSCVTNMVSFVSYCINLASIPELDTSNVTTMQDMFNACFSLTSTPNLNTDKVVNMSGMFYFCQNLRDVSFINTSHVNNMTRMFGSCNNLSNDSLNNILGMCTISNITRTADKKLKSVGLSQDQANICVNLSNWANAEAAGWTTGY